MTDIFISYASEDRDRVKPLAEALADQGWSVFWDRTIPAGKTWRQVIGDALETARSIIVAWSNSSVESSWVQEEADSGRERNILIPILIDDVKPPLGFRAIQAADLISWEPTQSSPQFEKLISDLSSILGPPPIEVRKADQKRVEEERRHKQEEERKLRDDEQRKAEEERERLEEEKQLLAEEKRKFAEEQKRIESAQKAEEERKQKEAETKRKAEEEQKHKKLRPEVNLNQPEAAKIRPHGEYPFFVLYTFNELKILSTDTPLILFTDKAERGFGERSALKTFNKKIFPEISQIAENSNTKIAWANVGGIINLYDIAKFLREKGLRFSGVFLIKNGDVLKSEKRPFLSTDEEFVDVAKKILT